MDKQLHNLNSRDDTVISDIQKPLTLLVRIAGFTFPPSTEYPQQALTQPLAATGGEGIGQGCGGRV